MKKWFARAQHLVPQQTLSALFGRLSTSTHPAIKTPLIAAFAKVYKIDLKEYKANDLSAFASFEDFFTRPLQDGARPIQKGIISPADGKVSQYGLLKDGRLIQAKGLDYDAGLLLADYDAKAALAGGSFATIYLAPNNYHRVHMPFDGTLVKTTYVPGELFSVNEATAAHIPDLFARNERLICAFDTAWGLSYVVMVGAMVVAGIECVATGKLRRTRYSQTLSHNLPLKKGDELGRFYLGSTAIVLVPKTASATFLPNLTGDILMGQTLAL